MKFLSGHQLWKRNRKSEKAVDANRAILTDEAKRFKGQVNETVSWLNCIIVKLCNLS